MKWSHEKYKNFVWESREDLLRRDGSLDNAVEYAQELLMHTQGLGPWMLKRLHIFSPTDRLATDILQFERIESRI